MTNITRRNQDILLILNSATLMLSSAVAKLFTFNIGTLQDILKDIVYAKVREEAYIIWADDDMELAEKFIAVSNEIDKLFLELE